MVPFAALLAVALHPALQAVPPPVPPPSAPAAAIYETRTAQYQTYRVGRTANYEVWLAWGAVPRVDLRSGMQPGLVVVVGNASGQAVPFDPAGVKVWERSGSREKPLRILSAEQVEKKRRNGEAMANSLHNHVVGSVDRQPVSSVVGNPSTSSGGDGDTLTQTRSFPAPREEARGNRFPASAPRGDGQHPDNAAADRVAPMGSGAPATLWAMRSTLMRPGTVEPGTYFGGLVYVDPARLAPLRVEVKVGAEEFRFDLEP